MSFLIKCILIQLARTLVNSFTFHPTTQLKVNLEAGCQRLFIRFTCALSSLYPAHELYHAAPPNAPRNQWQLSEAEALSYLLLNAHFITGKFALSIFNWKIEFYSKRTSIIKRWLKFQMHIKIDIHRFFCALTLTKRILTSLFILDLSR